MKTDTFHAAIEGLRGNLPPVFPRREVPRLLGGALAAGTLANLGTAGPPFYRQGRHAVYERESFLKWYSTRFCAEQAPALSTTQTSEA